jgi:hypothetical protein
MYTQDALKPVHQVEAARVFGCIFVRHAAEGPRPIGIMIDATHPKAHRTTAGRLEKRGCSCRLDRTKYGLASKLQVACDGGGKPLAMLPSEGQMSDQAGAKLHHSNLPTIVTLIACKHRESAAFRQRWRLTRLIRQM